MDYLFYEIKDFFEPVFITFVLAPVTVIAAASSSFDGKVDFLMKFQRCLALEIHTFLSSNFFIKCDLLTLLLLLKRKTLINKIIESSEIF